MKQPFTVILLYPDYATGDFGADIYVDVAEAKDPYEATGMVRKIAAAANTVEEGCYNTIPAEDFRPIAVFKGDLPVELDATNF